mgnify:CR=1 FL=1
MDSKRVLILSPNIGLHMGLGGGCRVAAIMAELLAKAGFEVILTALRGLPTEVLDEVHGTQLSKFKAKGLVKEAYIFGYGRSPRIPFPLAVRLITFYLRKLIKEYNPALLIFHDDIPRSLENILRRSCTRVILYSHFPYAARVLLNLYDPWEKYLNDQKGLLQRIYRTLLKRVLNIPRDLDVKLISNSTVTKKFMKYLWKKRSEVIYPPVVCSTATNNPPNLHTKKDIVLVLAPLQPNKRVGEVIEAFSKCQRGKLIIAGWAAHSKYVKYLQKKVKELDLSERVRIYTNVSEQFKWSLLAKAKIIISAAFFEPFGVSIVEGMSSGVVPIVRKGTLSGPWIDIVCHGTYGLGFSDLEELSSLIDELLSNSELFRGYSAKAYARSRYFGIEKFSSVFLMKIEEIMRA